MDISVLWHEQVDLVDGSDENLIYSVNQLDKFEGVSGVYMFCRVYRKKLSPLYVGKALELAARIRQQLNNLQLMKAMRDDYPSGRRVLVIGEFQCKPGQNADKCIRTVEKALIEHALTEGFELINQQGTKTPYHEITFAGNAFIKAFTGKQIYLKKSGG